MAAMTMNHTATLATLPPELLTLILPQLDQISLIRLAGTCASMRSNIYDFLQNSKTLDMKNIQKAAFMFLTRNGSVTSLTRLSLWAHPDRSMVNLNRVRKFVRQNRNLEALSLVNIQLIDPLLDVIMKLPQLKFLEVSHVKKSQILEVKKLKKKGCRVSVRVDSAVVLIYV
eukprot:GFUD01080393.1.p1 GENE.GFUD01080393.1~~GFUD01080393.1.p1  ORF type:complete len:171 (+),score=35.41 GFUD01080393.1:58-570(+)